MIFVANLPLLFASTAWYSLLHAGLAGWLAALNFTFAIEPIRAAYSGSLDLSAVPLRRPTAMSPASPVCSFRWCSPSDCSC